MSCGSNEHLAVILPLLAVASLYANEIERTGILLPNLQNSTIEPWFCTPIRLNYSRDFYILKFEPQAREDTVHHIVLYGCLTPSSRKPIWRCGGGTSSVVDSEFEYHSPCGSKPVIVFAWAKNAPTLELPPDVGFRVGGSTDIQYLVMQVHYTSTFKVDGGGLSTSGLFLHTTSQPTSKMAGLIFLRSKGSILPMSVGHWETSCTIVENKTIHPFAFRVHTHSLGTVVTGYRVRADSDGKQHWTLIGRKNPLKPQMYYPVANNITVTKGDILAVRCSFYNKWKKLVYFGPNGGDEMCNLSTMYYVEGGEPLKMTECWARVPFYHWNSDLDNIPADASALE